MVLTYEEDKAMLKSNLSASKGSAPSGQQKLSVFLLLGENRGDKPISYFLVEELLNFFENN